MMIMMVFLDRTILKSYDFTVVNDRVKIARIFKRSHVVKRGEASEGQYIQNRHGSQNQHASEIYAIS